MLPQVLLFLALSCDIACLEVMKGKHVEVLFHTLEFQHVCLKFGVFLWSTQLSYFESHLKGTGLYCSKMRPVGLRTTVHVTPN